MEKRRRGGLTHRPKTYPLPKFRDLQRQFWPKEGGNSNFLKSSHKFSLLLQVKNKAIFFIVKTTLFFAKIFQFFPHKIY